MYKKLIAIAMLCVTLLSGCSFNTDVSINEDGKYTMETKETSGDDSYKKYYGGLDLKEDDFISYKHIDNKGIIFKVKKGLKFDKKSKSIIVGDDTIFSDVEATTVTVSLPKEVKSTNGVVDSSNKNKVVFDLATNVGTYYAYIDDTKPESKKPIISGFKNGNLYTKDIKVSAKDDTRLSSLKINGKKVRNNKVISKAGCYAVEAVDCFGNSTIKTFIVNKDKTAPSIYWKGSGYSIGNRTFLKRDNLFFLDKIKKNGSIAIKSNSAYIYITDNNTIATRISKKPDLSDTIFGLNLKNVKVAFQGGDASVKLVTKLVYTKKINSLKEVTINKKKVKIKDNGVVFKVQRGKTYSIRAVDKAGNVLKSTLKVVKAK